MKSRVGTLLMVILVFISASATLWANGNSENETAEEPIVLKVWNRNGTLMGGAVEAFNAKMEAEGRDLRAEFTLVPYEEQSSKFLSSLAAKTAPDVYAIDLILAPYFSEMGAWMDITTEVNNLGFQDDLNPGMFRIGEWNGKQYCLPWANDNSSLIYNKTIFTEMGLEPPTTWEETLQVAKIITEQSDKYGITFSGANSGMTMFTWLPFAWMNGAQLITDNGKDTTIDSEAGVGALQFWAELAQYAPEGAPVYDYGDYYNGFVTGQVAMIFGGSWHVMSISNDAPELDFGIIPFPVPEKGNDTSAFMGGDIMGITAQTAHPKEAMEFVAFCLSEETQIEILAKNGSVPVRLSVAVDNPYFDKDPRYKVFAAGGQFGRAPKALNYNDITTVMGTIMPKALSGEVSPEDALKEAAPQIRDLLQ
ncbi:MAG: sugar ABC transporter substrate-binding protein [Spirochaetales bacterium]|nr:sugar ABC transporter substrate-binding protein [Spirochaetales bacterium]